MRKQIRPAAAALAALCGVAIGTGALLPGSLPGDPARLRHDPHLGSRAIPLELPQLQPVLRSFAVGVLTELLVLITSLIGWCFAAGAFSFLTLATGGLWIGLE